MAKRYVVKTDLADIWATQDGKNLQRTVAWGDELSVTRMTSKFVEVETVRFDELADGSIKPSKILGYIVPKAKTGLKPADVVGPASKNDVLKVNFIDVQQGDGCVIESPDGKIILLDGGDNQLFARYLASRFRGTTPAKPKDIDCIVVTHGDADHFAGLAKIHQSEQHKTSYKRLFMQPQRVYHNGLVKRPSTKDGKARPEKELLGPTKATADGLYLTGLVDNLLKVPDGEMNEPFKEWKSALQDYNKRSKVEFRRLEHGDTKAFGFFNTPDLQMDVLGPLVRTVGGKPALRFLGDPPHGPRLGHEALEEGALKSKGFSASHTINGHSVVLRLRYGNFSYLFSGDLNDESGRFLVSEHNKGNLTLRAEVFKVPHHGSADFSGAFIRAVSPLVSVVSSGDESARKEYIHPRATLMGALGRYSRIEEPLVLVTELVAFFNYEKQVINTDPKVAKKRGPFAGFSRTAFGAVKTRTDGQRLFVFTDSGNVKLKEAYAYQMDENGVPQPDAVVRV